MKLIVGRTSPQYYGRDHRSPSDQARFRHLRWTRRDDMKPSTKPWPLKSIHGIRNRINTNPDFQRPAVWGLAQKQLLVDSILRDYDIPKLYWRKTSSKPDKYDVVDGQQRLRAIWGFFRRR